ncbi:hypothetical protein SKDZ_13G3880 [Saccharomyces kudriavzevii ZP591]|nr:hypothetical protein SKDZ_13G3880 [Saccharomyces kudriavzevii ZP591]
MDSRGRTSQSGGYANSNNNNNNNNNNSNSNNNNINSSNNNGNGPVSNGRANGKQRLTAAQQQYIKNLIETHITDNHPDLRPKSHPMDFEEYTDAFLRRYKDHFQLDVPDSLTLQGYLLGSELGAKTYSYRRNTQEKHDKRIHKKDLANVVRRHFDEHSIKETDCIPQFIYKVKNQKKKFKMEFRG